ncbi:MAG TPA: hypothetical protein VKA94_16585, partial [Hyphomicrobiales bacterium]|nr:hypothetical protein [Hyphomicrobiales bacterium]
MYLQRSALTLLLSAGLLLMVHSAPAEAGKICKPMVWGYGLHANQNIAKIHALGAWTTKAKNKYGAAYGNYGAAKSKSQKCR